MTKLKTWKFRYYAVLAFALVLGVSSYLGVKAYSGDAPQNVAEAGGTINVVNNAPASQPLGSSEVQNVDPVLGAVTGPNLPNPSCQGNLCTWVITQDFIDATTTAISIVDPWLKATSTPGGSEVIVKVVNGGTDAQVSYTGATTSVNLARLEITGAARTTWTAMCGGSISSTTVPTVELLSSGEINTNTVGFVENNLLKIDGGTVSGGTTSSIMIGAVTPYLNCIFTPFVGATGMTNSTNTFTGKGIFRFNKYIY